MKTAYITHPRYIEHDQHGHPEHAGRIRGVWQQLESDGLASRMQQKEATPIAQELLHTVHTETYLALLEETVGQNTRIDADTYVTPTSYEIARLSAGGLVDAVEAVLSGSADNAMAVTRPPGHHAMPDRAMGFCLLGNIALGARYAQQVYNLKRILIVDYDVHHGNGTEAMFYNDPSVLFVSIHQAPLYPGTGAITDIGVGEGKGYNVNIPLSAGHGDSSYAALFEHSLWALARRYQPELILVSAGHDAHFNDPLANIRLTLNGYAHLAQEMIRMADELCGGKIAFLMEGGYNIDALRYGWSNIARSLLRDTEMIDPLGDAGNMPAPPIDPVIDQLRKIHNL